MESCDSGARSCSESTRGGSKGFAAVVFAFSASGLFYHHLRTIFGVGCRTRERVGVVSRQGVGCRGMDRIVSVGV